MFTAASHPHRYPTINLTLQCQANTKMGRYLDQDFCFMHTPKPHHRNQKWYLCWSQAQTRREGCRWGADDATVKRIRRPKSFATQATPTGSEPKEIDR